MNSEELEKSLRTEFENHLKDVLAEMRQELEGFQEKFETEIENHKTRLGDVLQGFSAKFDRDARFDEGFKESVVEHLRLARDEGARITAEAISEAEQMEKDSAPAVNFYDLRDAVNEISNQNSQAEILKSLVDHAAQYVPRGAFFIVKNEYFVGWRVFGKEAEMDDREVREIFFPVSDSTVLGESVRSLVAVESSYGAFGDDAAYLDRIGFGQPDRMYAIPLIARGRGVAVLYADYGHEGTNVNVEALETLMRVAGLTVELLAASRGGSRMRSDEAGQTEENVRPEKAASFADAEPQTADSESAASNEESDRQEHQYGATNGGYAAAEQNETAEELYQPVAEDETDYSADREYRPETENEASLAPEQVTETEEYSAPQEEYSAPDYSYTEPVQEPEPAEESTPEYAVSQPASEEQPSWNQPVETNGYAHDHQAETDPAQETSAYEGSVSPSDFHAPAANGYDFQSDRTEESNADEAEPVEAEQVEASQMPQSDAPRFEQEEADAAEEFQSAETSDSLTSYEPQPEANEPAYAESVETVSQSVVSQPVKTRFSERNVDLPIEVEEGERRLHNDARRFARLLVSEIKLYNEQKVNEGRVSYDLYDRLREAIDRSREMYEKRVQPPVAAKFDYFHYELINSLAEGDEARLGGNYPGANS